MAIPLSTDFRVASEQQQRLFRLENAGTPLSATSVVLIDGDLDEDRLRKACRRIVQHYDVFRTAFVMLPESKVLYRAIQDHVEPAFDIVEMALPHNVELSSAVDQLLRQIEAAGPASRGKALIRFSLVKAPADRHILVIIASPLVADGRTLENIVSGIASFYAGENAPLPDGEVESPQPGEEFARLGKVFWEEQNAGSIASPPLLFESKAPRPGHGRLESVFREIDPHTAGQVQRVAQLSNGSPASVFLGCWYSLLWRLSGKEDVIVHCSTDGRGTPALEKAMGLFSQPLPMCMRFDPDPSFWEIVGRVEELTAEAIRFQQYLPSPEVSAGVSDPVAFEYERACQNISAAGLKFSILWKHVRLQPFKLKLHVIWRENETTLEFQQSDAFPHGAAERIASYYDRLLRGLLADHTARISAIDILDEAERSHLLVDLNQTQHSYPKDRCIHQLFEAQVEQTPDKPALVFRARVMTYAELNAAANRLAHHLRAIGVTRGVRVGLCLNRGAEMIIALFGILKAGAAYVPLFPEHPKARREHQLIEAEAQVLLTQENYLERLPDFSGQIVCVDRDSASISAQPDTNPENVNAPEDLIYVMYTSGSTGLPKGVATRHENVVNYTSFVCRKFGLPNDRLQNFALVSYLTADLGKTSIFPPLVSGACVHVIGYDESVDGGLWADYCASHRIDVLKISPSHISALLASSGDRNVLPREFLIVGGEFFTWDMVRRVRQAGSCQIVNHYAPTECTIGCLMYDVRDEDPNAAYAATVPMGRPISNVDVYILDQHRRPVPTGVPGEIYIGGDCLSNGYVNQPQQTAERFVPHPFRPGQLIYRSGDRGRYLPDGSIESLGRTDNQVKIRGFRVELAEIEATLSRHPSVRQAIVIAPEVQAGDRRLSAFVLLSGPEASDDLHAYLREHLPDYMIPGEIGILDTLPLLPNGKTDRLALAALADTRAEGSFAAPRNHCERVIAKVWSEVLDRQDVGINDNFFELGGHSLIATMVIARLRSAFDIELPLRTIFERPTVAELAAIVERAEHENASSEQVAEALAEIEKLSDEEIRKLLDENE